MSNGKLENYLRPYRPAGNPFRGTNKPKRKARIASKSKKQRELDKTYSKLRKEFLEDHCVCAVAVATTVLPDVLYGNILVELGKLPRATEIHHKRGRGRYLLDTSTWAAVSAEGHKWIHANPQEAEALGLLHPDRNRRPIELP